MSDKDLHTSPHAVRGMPEAWWYEEPKGITVVVEFRDNAGDHLGTKQVPIPWYMLRNALARKER